MMFNDLRLKFLRFPGKTFQVRPTRRELLHGYFFIDILDFVFENKFEQFVSDHDILFTNQSKLFLHVMKNS